MRALARKLLRLRDAALGTALTGGDPTTALRRLHDRELRRALAGKTVLVTGASSGIGRAVALKASSAGACVVLVARSLPTLEALAAEISENGGCARSFAADLSSAPSAAELLSRLAESDIGVDVLVNNAGRSIRRPLDESYERVHDFERTMALNYFGSLRLILGLLPGMRRRRRGHVINVSSAGVQMSTPMFSAYVASKAALDAFTRVAAAESRGDGVRFTTVYMPLVRTPMIAPTKAYRRAPALSPEQAAELVLRPVVTNERTLGTRLAELWHVGHVVAPDALEAAVAFCQRVLAANREEAPSSRAA